MATDPSKLLARALQRLTDEPYTACLAAVEQAEREDDKTATAVGLARTKFADRHDTGDVMANYQAAEAVIDALPDDQDLAVALLTAAKRRYGMQLVVATRADVTEAITRRNGYAATEGGDALVSVGGDDYTATWHWNKAFHSDLMMGPFWTALEGVADDLADDRPIDDTTEIELWIQTDLPSKAWRMDNPDDVRELATVHVADLLARTVASLDVAVAVRIDTISELEPADDPSAGVAVTLAHSELDDDQYDAFLEQLHAAIGADSHVTDAHYA